MKEATGELNMTVITVVAIAAVAAFFYAFVWPVIKENLERTTKCNSAVCNDCEPSSKTCKCVYLEGDTEEEITCKNPGYAASGSQE